MRLAIGSGLALGQIKVGQLLVRLFTDIAREFGARERLRSKRLLQRWRSGALKMADCVGIDASREVPATMRVPMNPTTSSNPTTIQTQGTRVWRC